MTLAGLLRYADNMRDDGANMDVVVTNTDKKSIEVMKNVPWFSILRMLPAVTAVALICVTGLDNRNTGPSMIFCPKFLTSWDRRASMEPQNQKADFSRVGCGLIFDCTLSGPASCFIQPLIVTSSCNECRR